MTKPKSMIDTMGEMTEDQKAVLPTMTTMEMIVYKLLRTGHTQSQIAKREGVTRQAIGDRVARLKARGLPIPRRDDFPIRLRDNWTQAELHELVRLYNKGYGRREMAQAFGRTYTAVWQMIISLREEGVLSQVLPTPRLWRIALQMRKEGRLNYEIDTALGKASNYTSSLFSKIRRRGIDVPPSPYLHGSRKNDTRD